MCQQGGGKRQKRQLNWIGTHLQGTYELHHEDRILIFFHNSPHNLQAKPANSPQ